MFRALFPCFLTLSISVWASVASSQSAFSDSDCLSCRAAPGAIAAADFLRPVQAASELWAAFDARPLTVTEKRFLQAGLALEGHYKGLIDGAWGPRSQAAMEAFAAQFSTAELVNADAAMLTMITLDRFASEEWEPVDIDYLALSIVMPLARFDKVEEDGMREVWDHRDKDITIFFDDLDDSQLRGAHAAMRNHETTTSVLYTLHNNTRWVTSVATTGGLGYMRSDLISGTWSTVLILTGAGLQGEMDLLASSIAVGAAPPIIPSLDGRLLTLTGMLATRLAEDDAETDTAPERTDRGVAQLPPEDDGQTPGATGTGFLINDAGTVLTNAHVIAACDGILVDGRPAEIVADGTTFDLAALRAPGLGDRAPLPFSVEDAGLNADITIAGYPLHGLLGGLNVSRGSISGQKGLGGDETVIQISAPVQPGNSGGPAVDRSGHVTGVVVAKLDAVELADLTGDIAQNVNFAIRGAIAKVFLQINGIPFEQAEPGDSLAPEAIARRLQDATVLIECAGN